MKSIQFPAHVADVMILVEADTPGELFSAALEGMNYILTGGHKQKVNRASDVYVEVTSGDRTSLLIDFLSEVLTLSYVNKAVYNDLHILKIDDKCIRARIMGSETNRFAEEIKGVSYHMANVKSNASGKLTSYVLFDI